LEAKWFNNAKRVADAKEEALSLLGDKVNMKR